MSKDIKNRITLDASRFERGAAAVSRASSRMQRALGAGMARAARIGAKGLAGAGVAAIGAGVATAAGVKGVVKAGGALEHLSQQTGASVAGLMALRQAFEDNGVSGESARLAINKLQKGLVAAAEGTGEARKAFDTLGISVDELRGMDPVEQFQRIGSALNSLEDPADRATAAMRIFGESGAEMQSVFGEGKIEDAAASLGKQAQLMQKNSKIFERTSTLLDRSGNTLKGFFVGVADKVVPVILPLLERLDRLDLAGHGQRFGQGIARGMRLLIGVFKTGVLKDLFAQSLILGGKEAANHVARMGAALGGVFGSLWADAGKGLEFLSSGTFWNGVSLVALGSFQKLGGGIIQIFKDPLIVIESAIEAMIEKLLAAGQRLSSKMSDALGMGPQDDAFHEAARQLRGEGKGGFLGALSNSDIAARRRELIDRGDFEDPDRAPHQPRGFGEILEQNRKVGTFLSGLGETSGADGDRLIEQGKADIAGATDWSRTGEAFGERFRNAFESGMREYGQAGDLFDTSGTKKRLTALLEGTMEAGNLGGGLAAGSRSAAFGAASEDESPFAKGRSALLPTGVSRLASIGGGGGVGGGGLTSAIDKSNQLLSEINRGIRGLGNKIGGISNEPVGISSETGLI